MKVLAAVLLLWCSVANAKPSLPNAKVERLADAIYIIEGGARAKVPYGILSVPVRSKAHARQICITTIRNTHQRWVKAGSKGQFIDYLADRYCPPTDSEGNKNWKRNIRRVLVTPKPKAITSRR